MDNILIYLNSLIIGGTQITISGYGFPEGMDAIDIVMVAVGSKSCRILTVSYDEITCIVTLDSVSITKRALYKGVSTSFKNHPKVKVPEISFLY